MEKVTTTPTPLMTAEEAASYLRIHIDTLRRYAAQGLIPSIRIGWFWRFDVAALSTWVPPVTEKETTDGNN